MKNVTITRRTLEEMRTIYPRTAEHMERAGFTADVVVISPKAAFEGYETTSGDLVFVHGSRSLFERYKTFLAGQKAA